MKNNRWRVLTQSFRSARKHFLHIYIENHVLHPWGSVIISQRAKDFSLLGLLIPPLRQYEEEKGSELFLPSVCDLLRKMVLARGWSEGLYSMGRSGSRSNRINPLGIDLKPKWMATDTTNSSQQNILSTGVATLWWRWGRNVLKQSKTVFWQPEKLI